MNSTLNELADRLEKAEGPCRKLDLEIFKALSNPAVSVGGMYPAKPKYTSSLDAAMGLVDLKKYCCVSVYDMGGWNFALFKREWRDKRFSGKSKDQARAITAASLRALAVEG